jgi:hypothetical protein
MGILMEGLICKGWRGVRAGFQQSYPQENWTACKALKNQGLTVKSEKTTEP